MAGTGKKAKRRINPLAKVINKDLFLCIIK